MAVVHTVNGTREIMYQAIQVENRLEFKITEKQHQKKKTFNNFKIIDIYTVAAILF